MMILWRAMFFWGEAPRGAGERRSSWDLASAAVGLRVCLARLFTLDPRARRMFCRWFCGERPRWPAGSEESILAWPTLVRMNRVDWQADRLCLNRLCLNSDE